MKKIKRLICKIFGHTIKEHIKKTINHENEYSFEKMFPKALKALVEEQLEKDEKVQVLFTKLIINSI